MDLFLYDTDLRHKKVKNNFDTGNAIGNSIGNRIY